MSIIILHAGSLGDCVLTIHLARAMTSAWGNPSIVMVARSRIARWAQRRGLLSEAWTFEQLTELRLYDPSPTLPESTMRFLAPFDRIVSFLGGPDDTVSARLRTVVGPSVLAVDPRPCEATISKGIHITQQWADQLAQCGCPVSALIEGAVGLPAADKDGSGKCLRGRLGAAGGEVALFHPGSGGLDKCCPLEAFERLLTAVADQGWCVGWIIGPDEVERFGSSYLRRLEVSAPVILEESVETAADLVCGAGLFIGNDAGMTHVAALGGVKTIALFGQTNPRVWRPLGLSCRVARFPVTYPSIYAWIVDILRKIDTPAPD